MMFVYSILDKFNFINDNQKTKFKKMCNFIFKNEKLKGKIFFDVTVVDSKESQKINYEKRGINQATDVISFALWDHSEIKTQLLGEIFINYNKVISQAKDYGHSTDRELFFLLSHGIYHLLGYDHQTKDEEKIMMNKQYESLGIIGLKDR